MRDQVRVVVFEDTTTKEGPSSAKEITTLLLPFRPMIHDTFEVGGQSYWVYRCVISDQSLPNEIHAYCQKG